jgi:hypothetical protein
MTSQPKEADAVQNYEFSAKRENIFGNICKHWDKYTTKIITNVAYEKRTSLADGGKKPANREKGTGK